MDATGTPERGGLEPEFVVELVRRLGREVGLVGGDVMEVAPPIARTRGRGGADARGGGEVSEGDGGRDPAALAH